MIKALITDGKTQRTVIVDEDNALLVKSIPIPTVSSRDEQVPLARYLTADGMLTGSIEMNVNGSVTKREFYIPSSPTGDRYITHLIFSIFDQSLASVVLKNFGNLAPLTNGVQIFYERENRRIPFQQGTTGVKTNFEMIRLCLGSPAFGDATGVFRVEEIAGSGGTALHGYFPILDLKKAFGFQWGIRLRQSADQKIIIQVQDDLTGLGQFRCYAMGFDLTPIS